MGTNSASGVGEHWEGVYRDREAQQVSWFQREPATSLRLLVGAGLEPGASVIDVGGGASLLVDRLLARGVQDVTVLDVAASALEVNRHRLGRAGERVTWLAQDLLEWRPSRRYDLWHDRAVYHFLTDPGDRARYTAVLDKALSPNGHVVIATFAEDGPEHCSGLPVARYSAGDLADGFPGLRPLQAEQEEHRAPSGAIQPFTWLVLSRRERNGGEFPLESGEVMPASPSVQIH